MNINLTDLSVDAAGEYLRGLVFNQQRDKVPYSYGCYSTFELNEGFKPLDKTSPIFNRLFYTHIDEEFNYGDYEYDDLQDIIEEEKENTSAYENDQVIVIWYWEGDGTLIIYLKEDNLVFVNYDCKKDHGWKKYPYQGE